MKSGFKMRSGNTSSFKMMGSSPAKVDLTKEEEEESVDLTRKDGPRVSAKSKKDKQNKIRREKEEANEIEHNVEAKMDEYPPKYFQKNIKAKKNKK